MNLEKKPTITAMQIQMSMCRNKIIIRVTIIRDAIIMLMMIPINIMIDECVLGTSGCGGLPESATCWAHRWRWTSPCTCPVAGPRACASGGGVQRDCDGGGGCRTHRPLGHGHVVTPTAPSGTT